MQHVEARSTAAFAAISIIYFWETFETLFVCAFQVEHSAREGVWGDESRWNSLVTDIATGVPAILIAVLLADLNGSPAAGKPQIGNRLPASLVFLALVASSSLLSELNDYWHGITVFALYALWLKLDRHAQAVLAYIAASTAAAATKGGSLLTLALCVNAPVLLMLLLLAVDRRMRHRRLAKLAPSSSCAASRLMQLQDDRQCNVVL